MQNYNTLPSLFILSPNRIQRHAVHDQAEVLPGHGEPGLAVPRAGDGLVAPNRGYHHRLAAYVVVAGVRSS